MKTSARQCASEPALGGSKRPTGFVFDQPNERFHQIKAGVPDKRLASLNTFGELLVAVLPEA